MKIYTKTGDNGTTSLFGGKRVSKNNKTIEALGAIDELNAWMGVLKLTKIQRDLMEISSGIVRQNRVLELEQEIDKMQNKLPRLNNFILPQNNIHIARAVCRRAERCVVDAGRSRHDVIVYLNRLNDYLFVLARYEDFKKGKKELIWKHEERGVPKTL
ncbi:MAG: cob(I)yrinic acid a,c-diamide adenosyltransferase [bacterium]|nr:cob(I)yrinic acid a,c-diamide adenosyltransferase [bacterium]